TDEARVDPTLDGGEHPLRGGGISDDGRMHGGATALRRRRTAFRVGAKERPLARPRLPFQVLFRSHVRAAVRQGRACRTFETGPRYRREIPRVIRTRLIYQAWSRHCRPRSLLSLVGREGTWALY